MKWRGVGVLGSACMLGYTDIDTHGGRITLITKVTPELDNEVGQHRSLSRVHGE